MQRMIDRLRRRAAGERGAAAVTLALLLVPLLGFAAIAVDIGSLYAEKARLQVAADAAAIAVAQDCSRGNCGDMLATAQALITANDGEGTAAHPQLSSAPLSVSVTGSTPKQHWFAPVIGLNSSAVVGHGHRRLGRPEQGHGRPAADLLLVRVRTADRRRPPVGQHGATINFTKTSDTTGCTGPSDNIVPGGFAYLDTDAGRCAGDQPPWAGGARPRPVTASPSGLRDVGLRRRGSAGPSCCRCSTSPAGTGTNAWYRVYGYAAFKLTGYSLGGASTTTKPAARATATTAA